ncbi:MAG: M91 family zinc metallopeptidase, partial [Bacteroidota bacterium]
DVADPFFQLVKDQLNATKEEFGENEEISEMFSFLESEESGEHTINIQLSKENKTKGSGKKTTIDYNPLNWEEPDDFDKEAKGKRDPRIGLVHEMKHSSDHAKGRDPRAKVDWTYEDSDKVYLYSQFEARALNIENILRKALYGKTRATYNVLDENGKVIKIKPPKRYVRE